MTKPTCDIPPPGWYCTRERGHEGPCAARRQSMITTARITDEWIPLPRAVLTALGWADNDTLTLEVVGDALLITRPDPPEPTSPPPPRRK